MRGEQVIEQLSKKDIAYADRPAIAVRLGVETWASAERVVLLVLLCAFWGMIVLTALGAMQS